MKHVYPVRSQWLIVLLGAAANCVNQADRIVMSIAIVPMGYDLSLSPLERGWILSSFFYGYVLTQITAGPIAKKHGPGITLAVALAGWCTCTVLTPVVAGYGTLPLTAMRVVMGVCEGFCWPAAYTWFTLSVDASRRSRAFTVLMAGGAAGQLAALLICPQLSWPMMFVCFGFAGFVWLTVFAMSDAPSPSYPESNINELWTYYLKMLSHKATRAILLAHLTHSWGQHLLMMYLPTYLHTKLGVSKESLWIVALPVGILACCTPVHGTVADHLVSKGVSLLTVRRAMTFAGFVIPGLVFLLFPHATTQTGAIALVSILFLGHGCLGAGVFSNHADILPVHAGMSFGMGNTFATLPALVVGPFTAYLISHGNNWNPAFYVAAAFNFAGVLVYLRDSQVTSIEHIFESKPSVPL